MDSTSCEQSDDASAQLVTRKLWCGIQSDISALVERMSWPGLGRGPSPACSTARAPWREGGMSAGDAIIFVVDDDASRRDVLPWCLRSVGLQITTFASAREFLHRRGADVSGCKV